jgi:excinuclease ABC subunit A
VIAEGTPEAVAAVAGSHTGFYLAPMLGLKSIPMESAKKPASTKPIAKKAVAKKASAKKPVAKPASAVKRSTAAKK